MSNTAYRANLDLTGTPSLVSTGTNKLILGTSGAGDLVLVTNGVERMRITSTGSTTLSSTVDFTLANDDYLLAKNAAGTAVGVLKIDSTDDTVLNAATGEGIKLSFNSVADVTLTAGVMTFAGSESLIPAATTAALSLGFTSSATGPGIQLYGNTHASTGAMDLTAGNIAGVGVSINAPNATGSVRIQAGGTQQWAFTNGVMTTGVAAYKIIPGATSFNFSNNANTGINLSILDAGHLVFGAASATIIPGVTSFAFRNNANNADNLSITDAGIVQVGRGEVIFNTALKGVAENIGTLAGAGSTQTDAAAIATTVVRVTGANGTVGVKLPALSAVSVGRCITIINSDTTNALKVYSNAAGETMTGQSGTTAISVAAKLILRCWKYDASNWYVEKGVAAY